MKALDDPRIDTAVLDIDGTLIDSVYAHVWSWREAFRVHAIDVPTWKIHRVIGMGGDRLVTAVTSETAERSVGDRVRDCQAEVYRTLTDHLVPTLGADDLLLALKKRGLKVVLASSGSREDTDRAVSLLDARRCIDATISGDDADATKPDSEPLERAVDLVAGTRALVVGDAVWDMQSAARAGYAPIGLRTGGIADCELLDAGALHVYDDPAGLADALDQTRH